MMEWQSPQFLYFILPLCVGWLLLALYSQHKRRSAREAFAANAMWSRIFPDESQPRFWLKQFLRELAIVASLVGLAGPRFGTEVEDVVPHGSDLYVLIDVSRSMLAEDVPPSRLARAKTDVLALLNRLNGERVGLIAFAGQAVVKCPMTVDYDSFRRALQELDPNSAPRGGTAIGDAIRKALEVLHAKADRDQSILLITDGDDQKSYPLEAAEIASERKVAIFAVGLGDSEQGARIPDKANAKSYVEFEGQQIWSKLDGSLLSEIALKTKGVYVPTGTKSYDLGELYTDHLQKLHSGDGETQQRVRRSEQFQWFLGLAVIALLIDHCIAPFRRALSDSNPLAQSGISRAASILLIVTLTLASMASNLSHAEEPSTSSSGSLSAAPSTEVREGLKLYSQEKYDEAEKKFSAAVEELDEKKSESVAIAAFDSACAFHRKGEIEKARENYLRAGLSKDRLLATTSHFNLGNLSAEQARATAGEKPELLAADKRQGVLDQLKLAVDAYRHCLELQPDHVQSRKNLELVRLWVKYYTDKWREVDRQKRRDESNLLVFLEYLMTTQTGLKEQVESLPSRVPPDVFAESKLAQDELVEEIPTLREKIATELKPQADPNNSPNATNNSNPADQKELEEGIRLLQSWADSASGHMSTSSKNLALRVPEESINNQQAAVDELDKIWDAIIPFQPLLAKELAEQTTIASTLKPNSETPGQDEATSIADDSLTVVPKENEKDAEQTESLKHSTQPLQIADDQFPQLKKDQERALRKTRMLAPKAAMELKQLEEAPPQKQELNDPAAQGMTEDPKAPKQVDPEQVKAGLRKAIELAPKAVSEMESAIEALNQKDPPKAYVAAEEARRILEEIQQSQPKNEQKQNDQQNDPKQQDQQQKQDQKDKSNEDKSEDKKDDKKDDKQEDKSKDKKKSDEKQSPKDQNQSKPQVSQERMAEALRKVRERQQEKQDRDRQIRAQILGRAPVDKDW